MLDLTVALAVKVRERVSRALKGTRFASAPMIGVAAAAAGTGSGIGLEEMVEAMQAATFVPVRHASGPFVMAVDHCFPIRGQGTVLTGTILSGQVQTNDVCTT